MVLPHDTGAEPLIIACEAHLRHVTSGPFAVCSFVVTTASDIHNRCTIQQIPHPSLTVTQRSWMYA